MDDDGRHGYLEMMRSLNERYLVGSSGVTEIWLVRHADPYRDLADFTGDPHDPPLSREGREQARRVAARLATVSFSAVWSSPALRAQQTAAAIGEHHDLPVRTQPDLREITTNWDEGRPSVLRPPGEYPFPEAESEVAVRMRRAATRMVEAAPAAGASPVRLVAVGHDSAQLVLLGGLLGLPWGGLDLVLPLTSVSVVAIRGDRMVVRSVGDSTHLC